MQKNKTIFHDLSTETEHVLAGSQQFIWYWKLTSSVYRLGTCPQSLFVLPPQIRLNITAEW